MLEAADRIGGGARTSELTLPGLLHDDCSATHPMAAGSPFLRSIDLQEHGLEWLWPEVDLAHPLDDGTAGVMVRSIEKTARGMGEDGAAWKRRVRILIRPLRRPPRRPAGARPARAAAPISPGPLRNPGGGAGHRAGQRLEDAAGEGAIRRRCCPFLQSAQPADELRCGLRPDRRGACLRLAGGEGRLGCDHGCARLGPPRERGPHRDGAAGHLVWRARGGRCRCIRLGACGRRGDHRASAFQPGSLGRTAATATAPVLSSSTSPSRAVCPGRTGPAGRQGPCT